MNSFLLFICFIITASKSFSQQVSLSLPNRPQVAYVGLDNPILCIAENISCDSIYVTTDNGSLTKVNGCRYLYRPLTASNTRITVFKRASNNSLILSECILEVRNIPDPVATIGGYNGGIIKKETLKSQIGIAATPPPSIGLDLKYRVESYAVTVIRKNELFFFTIVKGYFITEEIHKLIDSLQAKDVILFSMITALKADGRIGNAAPLEFRIE
ncbi:MAG TPA: GldM family protein [Chitinophagaceae bacterium]